MQILHIAGRKIKFSALAHLNEIESRLHRNVISVSVNLYEQWCLLLQREPNVSEM